MALLVTNLPDSPSAKAFTLYGLRTELDSLAQKAGEECPPIVINASGKIIECDFATPARAAQDRELSRATDAYFRERYPTCETPQTDDAEAWKFENPDRYIVREVSRYEARVEKGTYILFDLLNERNYYSPESDNFPGWENEDDALAHLDQAGDQETIYEVYDTIHDAIQDRFLQEEDAEAAALEASRNYYGYSYPWASTTCWQIGEDAHHANKKDWITVGFTVARYKTGDLYAGVDGGGYSFQEEHCTPLFLLRAARGEWLVETSAGYRRVVQK